MDKIIHAGCEREQIIQMINKISNGLKSAGLILHSEELKPLAEQLVVRKENVLAAMGMQLSQADNYVLGLIDEFTVQSKEISESRASFVLIDHPQFNKKKNTLLLDKVSLNLGRVVTSYLKGSTYIVVFAATCGEKVEMLSKQLIREGHMLEGYIVDLIGSELAEETADFLHQYIEKNIVEGGFHVTNRYSPGYCNWPVSDQHQLFSTMEGNTCGISLTPTSLMVPVKSVSGILGIGQNVKRVAYKCRLCSDEKCVLRGKVIH